MPVYNSESTLAKTLESLVTQDYPEIKIKIFDNCSIDGSVTIAKTYKEKYLFIEIIQQDKNIGAEANFTKCLEGAEGDYTAIVHADDIYERTFVSQSVAALEGSRDAVASFCHANEIDSAGSISGERFFPTEIKSLDLTILSGSQLKSLIYRYGNFIICPSVMARSDIYRDKIKMWNGVTYKTSADLDVWFRLSELGPIIALSKPLMKYRVAETSHSFRIARTRITKHDIFLVLERYLSDIYTSDYLFLLMKDQALRAYNILQTKNQNEPNPFGPEFSYRLLFKKMFQSKWHFKFGISIFLIKILSLRIPTRKIP